jgi:superoxide dismutase, Cu-Zn family
MRARSVLLTLIFLCLVGGGEGAEPKKAVPRVSQKPFARAELKPTAGSLVTGSVEFAKTVTGIEVSATILGARPGKHGIHVHEKGDCSARDASSAGPHYNPTGARHGGPSTLERHGGDLGNITVTEDGKGSLILMLSGEGDKKSGGWDDFGGKSVVVHESEDDLASQPEGSAGGRIACGVIQRTVTRATR